VKNKTAGYGGTGKKMLVQDVSKTRNNQELVKASIDALVKALEAGHSDALSGNQDDVLKAVMVKLRHRSEIGSRKAH
jgi:hypothetical protein